MLPKQILNQRYEIADPAADLIGVGAMGFVYRGTDLQTNTPVAIKALKPDITSASPDLITRFLREGEALKELKHPNIVKVFDTIRNESASVGDPEYFIVMEYIDGGTLEQVLRDNGRMEVGEVLELGLDLSDALTRTHRLSVIHRDLKPANVLMAADRTPRLTDFGMAHFSKISSITQDGTLIGTIDYLSPEALNAKNLDERADIWSFGVLLWEMLAGYPPFRRENVGATLVAILTDALPDLQSINQDVPDSLSQLLALMLRKDRQKRIPSMRLIGAEIEAIQQGRSTQDPSGWDQLISEQRQKEIGDDRGGEDAVAVDGLTAHQMVGLMIANSKARGEQYISLPSLVFATSIRDDLELDNDSKALMMRSALYHDESIQPWLDSIGSAENASVYLKDYYDSYPPPEVRERIVDALIQINGNSSLTVLDHVIDTDDSPEIRTKAALASARQGNKDEIIMRSLASVRAGSEMANLATLAALVDEFDLPKDADFRLKLQLSFVLANQRWKRYRQDVRSQSFRLAKYGLLMILGGMVTPFIMRSTDIDSYQYNLEAVGLPTWLLTLAVFFGLYGFAQGLACGFFPGTADALWIGGERRSGRILISSLSGLVYTIIMILFLGLQPDPRFVQRILYIPLTILLGLLVGALFSAVVPRMGDARPRGQQIRRMLISSLASIAINILYLYFLFQELEVYLVFSRLFFVGLLPLIYGLPFLLSQKPLHNLTAPTNSSNGFQKFSKSKED
ncbi:MAG: protein kinase domain-containing protein [Candidatus Promineifilaceae bacterium]